MKLIHQTSTKANPVNYFLDFVLERLLRRKTSITDVSTPGDFYVKTKDYIGNQIIAYNLYEKRELMALIHFLTPIKSFLKEGIGLDVGANIGNHSAFLAPYLQEVHAFEPNPSAFRLLELNTQNISNIKAHNFGLSKSKVATTLYVDSQNVGGSSTIKGRGFSNEEIEILLVPLDSLELYNSKLQIIKIDVEGCEYEVLLGAHKTIQRSMPIILLEQFPSDFDSSNQNCISLLSDFGYEFAWMAHDSENQSKAPRRMKRVINLVLHREVTFFFTNPKVPRGHYPMLIAIPPRFFSLLRVSSLD